MVGYAWMELATPSQGRATLTHPAKTLQHQILLLLDSEQRGAVAAPDRLELVRDVLAAGGNVSEDATERQIRIEPGATGRLEQSRGQHAAALANQRRVKLVCHPLTQRR